MSRIAALLSWILLWSVGVAAIAADDGEDACTIQEVALESPSGLVYYPFASREGAGQLRLVVAAQGQCRFGLALLSTSGAQLLGPGQPLNMTFRDRGNQVIPMSGNEQRWIQFEQTARGAEADLAVRLPRGQARRAGDYENTFVARIFANGRALYELDFRLSVRVAPQADLQLAGNAAGQLGRATVMNFGKAETGAKRSALLAVRANGAYNLAVASENRGQLRHVSLIGDNTAVPYTAWLDGQQLSLRGSGDSRNFPEPGDGKHMRNISVQIGETQGLMAGRYRDVLRVTITLLE
ncbi:hypothetical protein SAMN04487965_2653 [Microbulbifer donghaiensis]|uniref:Spore coat protein U (SCPU) domain-containing protein n=1 Tax=Microbulbifer donghaiensis TaxID=494016 RepID=A0A1M5EBV5_9GAMM|nr:hypothetical protein [Microbulbifer donghaiensis]SHF76753.1 hypothetical protein SAMN04487965_2653 [Microbulbifer donghaiensis]